MTSQDDGLWKQYGIPEYSSKGIKRIRLDNHLVAFIDLLGQSRKLARLRASSDSAQTSSPIMHETFGAVHKLRSLFASCVEEFHHTKRFPVLGENDSPFAEYSSFMLGRVACSPVGDAVALAIRLRDESGPFRIPAVGVWTALDCLAQIPLAALAAGLPVRGAIDIGLASTRYFRNEVYGPAIASVYELAEEVADYPRIVAGPGLIRRLRIWKARRSRGSGPDHNRALAKACFEYVTEDSDGQWILDYAKARPNMPSREGRRPREELIASALRSLTHQIARLEKTDKRNMLRLKAAVDYLERNS